MGCRRHLPKHAGDIIPGMFFINCSVFLVSFSLVGFEISLSRLLSVVLSYHYVFIILSLAMMGLGAGEQKRQSRFLALAYKLFPHMSPVLYAADLIGGALGSKGTIAFLNLWGGIGSCLFFGPVAALPPILLFHRTKEAGRKGYFLAVTALIIMLFLVLFNALGLLNPSLSVGKNPGKEIHDALAVFRGEIIDTKWSAFGRNGSAL